MSNNNYRNKSKRMSRMKQKTEEIDDNDILPFAVKIQDEELRRIIINKKRAWEENRHWYELEGMPYFLTKEYQILIEKFTTIAAGQAVDKKHWELIDYFTSNADDPDVAKTKLVKWLFDFVNNEAMEDVTQIHLSGVQGAGKTQFALLLAELWKFMGDERVILTNIKDVSGTTHIGGRVELEDWLDDNEGTEFMFVFDEINKQASGSDHHNVTDQLFGLITFLRKKLGNYIVIGHTGKDIHPWIRELCVFVHKTSNKVAKIYEGLDESGNPENLIKTIRGIPKTSLDVNTLDESSWSWADEQTRTCIGENKNGERCGTVIRGKWDEDLDCFCDSHKSQTKPHPSVPEDDLVDTRFEDEFVEYADDDSEKSKDNSEPIDGDEDDTPSEIESNETSEESESVENDTTNNILDNVPDRYWNKIEDKTGGIYSRENINNIDEVKEILSDSDVEKLESKL